MKTGFNLFFLLVLLVSFNVTAGLPPTTIKGQADAGKAVNFNLQVPNKQATKVSGGYLLETGNTNLLQNASFEQITGASSWVDSGTVSLGFNPSEVTDGNYSGWYLPSANTVTLVQDSTRYATAFADGAQCLLSIKVKTDLPLTICTRPAGVTSTTDCLVTKTDLKWAQYKIPFICGATSNGISITSSGSVTGTIYLDEAFVGAVDLKQDINNVGPWTSFTPTGSWTTNTTYTGKYRQNGENLEAQYYWVTSGAPTSATLTLNLPNGLTIDSSKIANSSNIDYLLGGFKGVATDAGAANNEIGAYYTNSTSFFVAVNPAGTTYLSNGSAVTQAVPFTWGNTDHGAINISVPVTQFSGSSSVYTAQCGANCEDTFSANVSATGVVSNENVEWITGDATVSSVSVYDLGTKFKTGLFTVAPNCVATAQSATNRLMIQDYGVTTSTGGSWWISNQNAGVSANYAAPFRIVCQKQGADFTASRSIIGTFNEVVTTKGTSKPSLCSAEISSAGVISNQDGGCFASCTNATTPVCTFTAGYWLNKPKCWHSSAHTGANNYLGFKTNVTTTTFEAVIYTTAGAVLAGNREYFCHGAIP